MTQGIIKMISRLLVVSLFLLPFQAVHAGMVSNDQVSSAATRANLLTTVSRADVSSQLQSMGVDSATAQDRIAAMTDDEVQSLSNQIDSLPAGASNSAGWIIAAVVIIGILVWYNWK